MIRIGIALIVFVVLVSGDVFTQSKINLGFSLGKGESFGRTYAVGGINAEYFVIDDLSLGSTYKLWIGAHDTQNQVSLYSNYFFPIDRRYRPYLGVFVRHTFVDKPYEDFTSLGFRAGLSFIMNREGYVSFGYVQEYREDCVGVDECNRLYPELSVGLSF